MVTMGQSSSRPPTYHVLNDKRDKRHHRQLQQNRQRTQTSNNNSRGPAQTRTAPLSSRNSWPDVVPVNSGATPKLAVPREPKATTQQQRWTRCETCREYDHTKEVCPNKDRRSFCSRKEEPQRQRNPFQPPKAPAGHCSFRCKVCGEYGHIKEDCPYKCYCNRNNNTNNTVCPIKNHWYIQAAQRNQAQFGRQQQTNCFGPP